ncbi:MAG: beta-eliminating lyase-related protein [Alphaproteobacteria bacterium]|nr:beta-eliminating lyase-related protein [Alphaproteobacteria bacterium]
MHFSSDNASGVAPEIMAALARANEGPAWAYGKDAITRRLDALYSEIFEREVRVFPLATGTAANALILASLTPPWGLCSVSR